MTKGELKLWEAYSADVRAAHVAAWLDEIDAIAHVAARLYEIDAIAHSQRPLMALRAMARLAAWAPKEEQAELFRRIRHWRTIL